MNEIMEAALQPFAPKSRPLVEQLRFLADSFAGGLPSEESRHMGVDMSDVRDIRAAADRIAHLETALNRIANGCRLPVNEHQRVVLKVATEALGEAYTPFPMQIV